MCVSIGCGVLFVVISWIMFVLWECMWFGLVRFVGYVVMLMKMCFCGMIDVSVFILLSLFCSVRICVDVLMR